MRLISCRCSEFTCTGENGLLSAGQHLSIQDTIICGHLSLLYVYLAIVNYNIFDLRLLSFDPLSLFSIQKKICFHFLLFCAIYFNLPFSIFKFMLIIFFIRDRNTFGGKMIPYKGSRVHLCLRSGNRRKILFTTCFRSIEQCNQSQTHLLIS